MIVRRSYAMSTFLRCTAGQSPFSRTLLGLFGMALLICAFALALVFATIVAEPAYGASRSLTPGELEGSTVRAASLSGRLEVSKYAIQANLDADEDRYDIVVTATVKNKTGKTFSALYFRNMAHSMIAEAKASGQGNGGVKTKILQVQNITAKSNLKYAVSKRDGSVVKVKLGKHKLKPGKTAIIRMKVRTLIPYWTGRFGYYETSKGKVYSLNWCYPYLADYRNGKWSLSPLPAVGENRFARATAYDVTITAPKKYQVATSGVSKTKGGKTHVKAKGLRDFAAIACNFMKKDVASVRGVRIVNWYLPGKYASRYRQDTMVALKDAVAYMSDHVGACAMKEVDVVQVFGGTFGAKTGSMEYPGLITIQGDMYYFDNGTARDQVGIVTTTTFHEMVHQWFFATVGNDEYKEPWLDEGIASYFNRWALWQQPSDTVRYLAAASGKPVEEYLAAQRELYRTSLSNAESGVSSVKLNRNADAFESYFSTVYGTSSWFLIQLEEMFGKSSFDSIMRSYYASYRLKEATTKDFLAIVRKHAPGNLGVNSLISKYFA